MKLLYFLITNNFHFILITLLTFSIWSNNTYFVVIVPSYNNEQWVERNLDSIFSQNYPHFRVIYINDASKDRTGELVQQYIKDHHLEDKCTYIENITNQGALYNLYHAIHSCDDKEVIVTVDGDDWLAHSQVLTRVSQEYQDPNIWITYGQFEWSTTHEKGCCEEYRKTTIDNNNFRRTTWYASHLRTFYAKLFKLIKYKDLRHQGRFFKVTWDLAMMFPMLEMAQERHRFIPDVLYVYNVENILNDFRIYPQEQILMETIIRQKKKYYRVKYL